MHQRKLAIIIVFAVIVVALAFIAGPTLAADKKPNIVIIWGDDIGQSNISAYSHGVMGYKTPNIDRVGQGRHDVHRLLCRAELHGRSGVVHHRPARLAHRTDEGRPARCERSDCRRKTRRSPRCSSRSGYATGQFGKNHLGDRNEFLPTVHGFDEFYGNLYHLNAEEEPELPDYPKDPAFRAKYGPRGVMDCKASDKDDPTVDPRFGKVGKQMIKDTGPLTKKRMETIDDDVASRAVDFIQRQNKAGKPFFVWVNFTPHALPHPHQAGEHWPGGALAEPVPRRHDRPRQECRHGPQGAG